VKYAKYLYLCIPVKKSPVIIIALLLLLLVSCKNTTEKVLKSSDTNYKYAKAMEWYDKGAYYKAIPVFEELMGLYKGAKTTEEIYYYYCMAQYKQGSYILAAYHFKNYTQKHPQSKYAEESLFMHAESYYAQSPKVHLDQTETINAINAYQVYLNAYPNTERAAIASAKLDELRKKLEEKALRAAELYYRTKNYRAAAISYKNLVIDFPDIKGEKEIQFKIVSSFFSYAEQSIVSKQQERYEDAIREANSYLSRYGSSDFAPLVKAIVEESHYKALQAALDYALMHTPETRLAKLDEAKDVFDYHKAALQTDRFLDEAMFALERNYFERVRTGFELAQSAPADRRLQEYQNTVEFYNNFINQFSNSKFAKEAAKIEAASQKNIKKLSNG
jgi:outer membrane protein assembly factor BamD